MKNQAFHSRGSASRTLMVMLCFFVMLQTSVFGMHKTQSITLKTSMMTIENVIGELKKQTSMEFFYSHNDIDVNRKVTIDVINTPLETVLKQLFGNSIQWEYVDNMVVIKPRTETATQKETATEIKGKVTDMSGFPLPGVTIHIKGTAVGTTTNVKGEFKLAVNNPEDITFQFRFVGMQSVERKWEPGKDMNVQMRESLEKIAEVVVTGYQRIDRRVLSSSVSSIKGEDVIQSNAISIDNMLQGKIPGLQVLNSTSTPGAATKVRIRGASTISGNREPLWVVDGIILDDPVSIATEELNNLDNVNIIGNAIQGLNPMDIESIDVLKDASATAIYGVRAANGVIVITTKKGKRGDTRVNYSGTFSMTERPSYDKLHRMNSKERIDVSKEIEARGLQYSYMPAAVGYEGLLYDLYDRRITYDDFLDKVKILEENNTDWFDILYRNSFSHKHNLSLSGATDKMNYYFSAAYVSEQANVKGTGVEQYNVMGKMQFNITPKFTATAQIRGSIIDKDYLHSSVSPYDYAYNTSRAIPAFNPDGSYAYYNREMGYNENMLQYNILNEIDNSERSIQTSQLNFNANAEWKILKGLRLTGHFSMNDSHTEDREWFSDKSYQAAKLRRLDYGVEFPDNDVWSQQMCKLPYGGELKTGNTRSRGYTARGQIDYNLNKGYHNMTLVAGTEARSTKYTGLKSTQWGYMPDRGEKFINIDPIMWPMYNKMLIASPDVVTNRLSNYLSWFGIATYSYKSRYIINGNIRADGSNKFGQDKSVRFLPIWSVSARWSMHNESFLKNVEWLNDFSFKGSYGIQGNVSDDQTPNLIMNTGALDQLSGEYITTLAKLPNPFLKWEKTKSYNVALDWAILGNRLSGTVEYYYKKGHDQIVSVEVASTNGSSYMSLNAGDIMNKGYELIVNAVPVKSPSFMWSLSINGGKNINKVTRGGMISEYTYEQYTNGSAIIKGHAINSFFSYKYNGLDEAGLPTFADTEETDGSTRKEMFEKVFSYSGNRVPDIQGGFSNSFNYKGFTLSAFFSYSVGSKIRLNNLYSNSGQRLPNPQQNMTSEFVNRWRKAGDESFTDIPTLSTEQLNMKAGTLTKRKHDIANNGWQMYNQSDLRVVTGNFLRLRSLSLRYSFKPEACKTMHLTGANIGIEGNNLWLVASKKLNGQDPEQVSFGGIGGTTPPVSTYSLVLNVTF
ncbi:MAG: SusC/RagA family TonB-linked outer membrane protein [Marinifilaceae bacterium]